VVADPAFFLFKVIDQNHKWVGNLYSLLTRDKDGKTFLFIDMFSLGRTVAMTQKQKDQVADRFIKRISVWAGQSGLDGVFLSSTASQRDDLGAPLRKSAQAAARTSQQQNYGLVKIGGNSHFNDFGVSEEHVQNFGEDASHGIRAVIGFLIPPDISENGVKEDSKESEIVEIESVLRSMDEEEHKLSQAASPVLRDEEMLLTKINEARREGKSIVVNALAEELGALRSANGGGVAKVRLEIEELRREKEKRRAKLNELRRSLGRQTARSELRTIEAYISAPDELIILMFGGVMFAAACALIFYSVYGWITSRFKEPELGRRSISSYDYWPVPRIDGEWKAVETLLANILKEAPPQLRQRYGAVTLNLRNAFQTNSAQIKAFKLLLEKLGEWGSIMPFMKAQEYYARFKSRTGELGVSESFDAPETKAQFSIRNDETDEETSFRLELSSRTVEDLFRGDISCDCTAIQSQTSFLETIPQFMFDPGFLNFKVIMTDKWVGNVYLIVAESEHKPVLVIDAVQLAPWSRKWPAGLDRISSEIIREITRYGQENGFEAVYLSSFVSNFHMHSAHLGKLYSREQVEIEKLGGFSHLKALGLWDVWSSRNQYLETFSPHWNRPLKVDPNSPTQKLFLRPIWKRQMPGERSELRWSQPASFTGKKKMSWQSARFTRMAFAFLFSFLTILSPLIGSELPAASSVPLQPSANLVAGQGNIFLNVRDIKKISWARPFGAGPVVGAIVELSNGRELIYGGSHGEDLFHFSRDLGINPLYASEKEPLGTRVTKVAVGTDEGEEPLGYREIFELAKIVQAGEETRQTPHRRFNASEIKKVQWSRGTRGLLLLGHAPVVGAIVELSNGREIVYGASRGNDLKYFAEDLGFKVRYH